MGSRFGFLGFAVVLVETGRAIGLLTNENNRRRFEWKCRLRGSYPATEFFPKSGARNCGKGVPISLRVSASRRSLRTKAADIIALLMYLLKLQRFRQKSKGRT